jgi:capsule polysaccharide export protein KpsE/RkpR
MKPISKEKLLDLKDQIDEAKPKVSELTGQKTALMKQLREEWECKSTEESNKKITKILADIKAIDERIELKSKELEEQYDSFES